MTYPALPEDKLHELGARWLAGEFLYDLCLEIGIRRSRLREKLVSMGYRLSLEEINRRKGRIKGGKYLSDLSDRDFEKIRAKEMEEAETIWADAMKNLWYDEFIVSEMKGTLPKLHTIVERSSSLGDLDKYKES